MEIFTDAEKQILEGTDKKFKWIARDKNGDLYFYETIPYKDECVFDTHDGDFHFVDKWFSDIFFKNITWENSPIQYRDTKRKPDVKKWQIRQNNLDVCYLIFMVTDTECLIIGDRGGIYKRPKSLVETWIIRNDISIDEFAERIFDNL